jgi:hypothetical protein
LVPELVTSRVTPGSTPPESSVTSPAIDPVACANADDDIKTLRPMATNTNKNLRMEYSLTEMDEAVAITTIP